MNISEEILLKALKDLPIGETTNFVWYITDIGIAALAKNKAIANTLEYKKEGLEIALDLSKETIEFFEIDEKKIFLFYS
tara:strand:+ start:664 stop:900 length:237 start_codon:yes stop_codon:yes gene_type:complete